jgi:hypothetical protein
MPVHICGELSAGLIKHASQKVRTGAIKPLRRAVGPIAQFAGPNSDDALACCRLLCSSFDLTDESNL